MILARNRAYVIGILAVQFQQSWSQILYLPVQISKPAPCWCFFKELIERTIAEVAEIGRLQNREFAGDKFVICNSLDAMGERTPDLKAQVVLGQFAVLPMGRGEHDIPLR